jgi:hypothetical protein
MRSTCGFAAGGEDEPATQRKLGKRVSAIRFAYLGCRTARVRSRSEQDLSPSDPHLSQLGWRRGSHSGFRTGDSRRSDRRPDLAKPEATRVIGVLDPYRLASCLPRRLGAARVCGWAASVAGDRHAVRHFLRTARSPPRPGIHGDPVVVISLDIAEGVVQTVRAIATPRSFGTSVRASIYAARGRDARRPEEPPDRYRPDRRRASGGERGAASARPVTRLGGRADRGGQPRRHGDAGLRHRPVPAPRSPIGLTSRSNYVIASGRRRGDASRQARVLRGRRGIECELARALGELMDERRNEDLRTARLSSAGHRSGP